DTARGIVFNRTAASYILDYSGLNGVNLYFYGSKADYATLPLPGQWYEDVLSAINAGFVYYYAPVGFEDGFDFGDKLWSYDAHGIPVTRLAHVATAIPLNFGVPANTNDNVTATYFKIQVAESDRYAIFSDYDVGLYGLFGLNPYAYLYDENFTVIYSDDDGAENYNFKMVVDLEAGHTYYLKGAFYAGVSGRSYTVKLAEPVTAVWGQTLTPEIEAIVGEPPKITDVGTVSFAGEEDMIMILSANVLPEEINDYLYWLYDNHTPTLAYDDGNSPPIQVYVFDTGEKFVAVYHTTGTGLPAMLQEQGVNDIPANVNAVVIVQNY
ncbi:MAG: hypothetical protein LBN25_02480, partial [Christensenellaceae bacterium]|nr:hypothetical protein [Christensenellaceae bacterium]